MCRARRRDKGEEVMAGTVMYGDNGVYTIYSRKKLIAGVMRKVMANKREIKETRRELREMQRKEKEEVGEEKGRASEKKIKSLRKLKVILK